MTSMAMAAARSRRCLLGGVRAALSALARALTREYRLRRQIAFLQQQDQRMLADIGLTHADVARSVRWGRDW
jgi:uncharacterized protein YjiS (DUF1127 family)